MSAGILSKIPCPCTGKFNILKVNDFSAKTQQDLLILECDQNSWVNLIDNEDLVTTSGNIKFKWKNCSFV